jgi:hypothetical protein
MMKIYLIGSLKNPHIPNIGKGLRDIGHDVFDDWHAGGPTADGEWQRFHRQRGDTYAQALKGKAARLHFEFDMHHLAAADAAILVLPAGKSAHIELCVMHGWSRPTFVFFDAEPAEWDLMYNIVDEVFFDEEALLTHFRRML